MRELALKILSDFNNSPNMSKHAFAVGYAMQALFNFFKDKREKPELTEGEWEFTGMLHDADYEITNKSLERHTEETTKKLKEFEVNQIIIDAIRGHCDKEPRTTLLAKSVYAVDELTGLIVATALVQPEKKLGSVTVDSILRKFKDKSFAAGANRDQIKTCETELQIPLEEFISLTLKSMQKNSDGLGL